MELILVRHAQPDWTDADGNGRNDPGLTELGHHQAARVAGVLADPSAGPTPGPVDRLVASPAIRAQETAAPIAAALDLPLETLPWLWELRNPDAWEGHPMSAIQAAFDEFKGRTRADMWSGIEGMESFHDFHERIIGGLHGLLRELGVTAGKEAGLWEMEEPTPQRVVAVAHGGTNSTIVAHLLGVRPEPWEWDRFMMGHASVAVLTTTACAGAHIWSLRALGDANHLDVAVRTR